MKSARGIYYDLKESEYSVSLLINGENIDLYFSSKFTRLRFMEKIGSIIEKEDLKLSSFYKVKIDTSKLSILYLYKKIEKRGFRVLINGNEINDSNLSLTII